MRRLTKSAQAMSKPDLIRSWVSESASASTFDENPDQQADDAFTWTKERVLEDWPLAMSFARKRLLTSSTKTRISFMQEELIPLVRDVDLDLAQNLDLFELLTQTLPRYVDSSSRNAVESVGMELVMRDELRGVNQDAHKFGVTELIVGWLANEVGRIFKHGSSSSCAPADLFVLLSWSCGLYTVCLKCDPNFTSTLSWKSLSSSLAYLLNLLLANAVHAKLSMRNSAIAQVRRALCSAPNHLPELLTTLTSQAESSQVPLAFIPLIGTTIDVSLLVGNVPAESPGRINVDIKDIILTLLHGKAHILNLYNNVVLISKTFVPLYASIALNEFIRTCITEDDFTSAVLPTMGKALLRSPEYSLSVIAQFFRVYPHQITEDIFGRLLTPILNSAKSTNPLVRANAIELFRAIVERNSTEPVLELAANELLRLPQAGKTAGPDHRATLYAMLSFLPPSHVVSNSIVQTVPPLLAKETHEAAASYLANVIPPHVIFLFQANKLLSRESMNLIAKEMNNTNPALRRAFCLAAGDILWECEDSKSEAFLAFANAVLPSLEANLKNSASNPLSSPPGPLTGYTALAVLIGPLSRSGNFGDVIARNSTIQSLVSSSSKPSFLLWDKVYLKVSDIEEEIWLMRASDAVLTHFHDELERNASFRVQLGRVLLHLALGSESSQTRRAVLAIIEASARRPPQLTNRIIRESLTTLLSGESVLTRNVSGPGEPEPSSGKFGRLSAVLHHCVSFNDDLNTSEREEVLVELIVLSHHYLAASASQPTWIALCQKARIDPQSIVNNNLERLFEIILTTSAPVAKSPGSLALMEASYHAITTLAFVSPQNILQRALDQLRGDIDPTVMNALTETDIAIWTTPEGKTFVDVLSSKNGQVQPKKGKDYEISQWEANVRKSLANKKPAADVVLTKQEQALVQAQLEKESAIRQRVASIKANLDRGLHIIRSLIAAGILNFQIFMSAVVPLLLEGVLHSVLADRTVFDTYLDLAKCCSSRLDSFKEGVGLATLRSLDVKVVPEEFQAEPVSALVLRVLYRLRSLSEQKPFDSSTFSYIFPLLGQILNGGGVGVIGEEDSLEQISLSIDIIKFHCGEFSDPTFPRVKTIEILIQIIRQQPRVAKDASSALINLGEAVCSTSSREEVDVLLHGTLHQETYVRNSCLQTLQPFDLTDFDWSPELWIACHDQDEQNARLARHIWDDNGLDVPESFLQPLLDFLEHENAHVRTSSPSAIAEAVESWPQCVQTTLAALQGFYREKAKIRAPEFDEYGMVIAQSLDRSDPWPTRCAIAATFESLSPSYSEEDVEPLFTFLIKDEALGDRNSDVRRAMLAAGTNVVDAHGAARLAPLITMFEEYLASSTPSNETSDFIKEAVIILIGRVARHLNASDSRIPVIADRLIDALKTPSEQVQSAVSECLSPLIKFMRLRLHDLVDRLLGELVQGEKYASRRGAAYGLAGIIKGTGLGGIKKFGIIGRLRVATEDKKRYESRQGAMFAFETLSSTLGRHFEPYIIHILPLLLTSFGDGTSDVREATQDAARVIMANMSAYGVKLILPSLLSGLDEKQWRTKKGSIELVGMMAYCSPKQLSLSLPIVIPRLTGVLTDSHTQVRAAANKSLKQFGEVINNPEIQSLVPVLLKALVDPAKIPVALTALLKTSFMHYIDHSSLALVIPILERGLKERGAETKKKAARIVGNLASLTDSKDFVPYLSELLPMVHVVLIDPVPEARATAAKALGTLVERLGENHFPDLVPGLLRTLKSNSSGIDRQGAAQGLSEVLSGLGMERLEGLLPDIIANAQSPRSTVREGFMSLLVFLPATFGTRFQPHLPKIIAPILGGLSDTEELVREAAMRAGRMVVMNYSNKAIDLLLPELERGMFDSGWRIRLSSVTLVGELLFKVSGISGKTEIEEEDMAVDTTSAESSRRALVEVLGPDRRDRILSALYMVRHDSVNVVRQSSIHIWKALVQNTPRTVRELLPELVKQVIALISSSEPEQQETAGKTTAELCRKFGEKVLAEIVDILQNHSVSHNERTRKGICLMICEVVENTSDGQRGGHEDNIIGMIRGSLVDDEANVRSAAAKAFDILQRHFGAKAIDQTIPTLLEALRQPGKGSGTALQALREVMSVRSSTVFPVLIPTLLSEPITVFNARALGSLVTVAGNALSKRLNIIMNSLIKVLEDGTDDELKSAVEEALHALIASVNDAEGLNTLMMILLGWVTHASPKRRVSANDLFAVFCQTSELDSSIYHVDWVRHLISGLEDPQVAVHTAAWRALDVFVKSIPKDELESLVIPLRRSIESVGAPGSHVPGFSLPKGISPTVPIIIAGLITGSNEQREQAAYAIGDLVERTEENAIKPFVVPFTGPLIRVATQATTYPPGVKTAILSALTSMLERIPTFVKPFFPQLQRTFVKSASDPASAVVRNKAAQALGVLMGNQPRVDPVVTELIGCTKNVDEAIASSLVLSLANVVKKAHQNIGEKAREACVELALEAFKQDHDENYIRSIAALVTSLSAFPDLLRPLVESYLTSGTPPSMISSHTILAILTPDEDGSEPSPNLFQQLSLLPSVAQKVLQSASSDKPAIARPAREARELLKELDDESITGLF